MAWRDIWNPESGGAEIYITKMANYLAKQGCTVRYMTPTYEGAKTLESIDGVEYIRPAGKYPSYFVLPRLFLKKYRKDTDVLIENFNGWPYLVPLLHRNVVIAFMHLQDREWYDHFPKSISWLFGSIFKYSSRSLLKLFYRNQDMISISPSSSESISYLKLKPKNLGIIYPGIENDLILDQVALGNKRELVNQPFTMFYVGRLSEHKRVHLAIELVAKLRELGMHHVLLQIAGRGEQLEFLQSLVKKFGIERNVNFLGFISDEEKYQLYQSAHIHIQPAEYEGWGMTVIEAAAKGTPSLGFNVKGLKDSIADSGYLVDSADELLDTALSIAKQIPNLQSDYWRKVNEAPDWARKFTWESQCSEFAKIVNSSSSAR